MANAFDRFDLPASGGQSSANPFDAFDAAQGQPIPSGLREVDRRLPANNEGATGQSIAGPQIETLTQEPEQESGSIFQDAAGLWGMGSGSLLEGAGWLFNSDELTRLGSDAKDYWQKKLSPEQVAANNKKFVNEDWSLGEGATDIRTYFGLGVQSLPMMVPGMGAAGVTAKAATALGAGKKLAAGLAAAAGSSGEGVTIGAMVGQEVDQTIRGMSEADKIQSPYYSDLRKLYGEEEATNRLSTMAANPAALKAGTVGAALGLAFNKFLGDALTGRLSGGPVGEGAKGLVIEGGTETLQSGMESDSKQRALEKYAAQEYSYTDLVNEMVTGLAAGSTMGAGVGALGGMAGSSGATTEAGGEADTAPPTIQDEVQGGSADLALPTLQPDAPSGDNAPVNDYSGRPDWATDQTNVFRDGVQPSATVAGNPFDVFDQAPVSAPSSQGAPQSEQTAEPAPPIPAASESLTETGTGTYRVPVDQIQVDPKAYQFRSRVNEQGVDKRLEGVKKWDDGRAGDILLHRRENGSLYVADGHHRLDLAKRLGQSEVNARVVDEADGVSVPDARLAAATNNIADGKAEALDAAKVFRDGNTPADKVRDKFNLPNNQLVRDGEALAKLSDNVFGMVAAGQMSEKDGATVGTAFSEQSQQEAAAKAFQKIEPQTDYQRQLLVNEIRAAEFAPSSDNQGGLFGEDAQEISLMQDRLKVLDNLRQQLNSDKRLFKSLNTHADQATSAGNQIATEANESITEQSARSLDLIGRVTTTPALNEMVNRAARRVYDGESRAAVVKDLKQELLSYERGTYGPDSRRDGKTQGEQPAAKPGQEPRASQPVPKPDTTEAGQGGQPEIGQPEAAPDLDLTTQTEASLAKQAADRDATEKAATKAKRDAEQKDKADAQADDFVLSGSDRQADVAEARGQNDLLSQAAAETDTSPTEGQVKADNYKKGHIRIQGIEIAIENPKGSTRSGTDPDGKAWENTMAHHYGDIKGTTAADGDNLDVFIGPDPDIDQVFVIDQPNADGTFDEHKIMLGFQNEKAAKAGYLDNYQKGWTAGPITRMSTDEFKAWMQDGDTTKPIAEPESKPSQAPKAADAKPSSQAESKAPAASQASGAPNRDSIISDFGQKLEGARKDYASRMADAKEKDVAGVPLSESWPQPDYQKMIDSGADPVAVGFARAARDEVPSKPRAAWKLKGWVRKVEALRTFTESIMAGDVSIEDVRASAKSDPYHAVDSDVFSRAELYAAVGHSASLKGLRFHSAHYTMFDGVKGNFNKWLVERTAKTTSFGNMPKRLVVADTKDEAIAKFKKLQATLAEKDNPSKNTRFDIYSNRHDKTDVFIGKKIGSNVVRIKEGFTNVKDARVYLAENQAALDAALEKMKNIPAHRKSSNSPRVGADHRNGGDVTPEAFAEALGFRGVQFGNYVEQGRRQADLNQAYDALMDLAGVIGIPAKAISLNGELGLALGARGKGGKRPAAAHYEPGQIVINLTKNSGAGSLAHEWWHSLDNYFGRERGVGSSTRFATDGMPADSIRPEMAEAFKKIRQTVNRSKLKQRSQSLDKVRTKAYWSTDIEMTARSFESYVIEKLKDQNASNDYLANIVSEEYWKASEALGMEDSDSYPYPEAAEIPEIRTAYDAFFEVVESKEADDGSVAMFSREGEFLRSPTQATPNLTATQAETITSGLMDGWKGKPDVIITDRIAQLPQKLREAIRKAGAESDMRGVFFEGKVYILASRIPTRAALEEVVLHEVVGHYGLRTMMGADLKPLLNQVYMSFAQSAEAKKIIRNYFPNGDFSASNSNHRLTVAEELLAHLAETGKHQKLWNKIVAAVREGLRKLGFTLQMTEADLLGILAGAQKVVERGGYSQPSSADNNFSLVMRDLDDQLLTSGGGSSRLKNPVYLKDGSRLSGFTNPAEQTTFYGYDKNGEKFTLHRDRIEPESIVSSRDGNRTANKIREGLQAVSPDTSGERINAARIESGNYSPDGVTPSSFSRSSQTDTEAFQKWFGDSKVVDESGQPLIVYHGSGSRFDTFDEQRMGSFTGAESAGEGFFFTANRVLAEQFRDSAQLARTQIAEIRAAVEQLSESDFEALADSSGMVEDYYTDGREFVIDQIVERLDEDRSAYFDDRSNIDQELRNYIDSDLLNTGEVKSVFLAISNPRIVTVESDTAFDDGLIAREVQTAKRAGNDGVIIKGMLDTAAMDDKGNNLIASDVYVTFKPNQIKSTENNGNFDSDSADIRFSRAGDPDAQPFGPPSDTLIRQTVSKFADKFTVLKGVQQNINERFGEISEDANAYRFEESFHGKVENDVRLIQESMVEPLAKQMSRDGVTLEQLDEFLYAMHAPERNKVIAARNPEMPDGGSGMMNAEAAAAINRVDQAGNLTKYKSLAGKVHAMLERRRQILKDAGLLDEDTLGAWEASYKFYVPLKGWAADEQQTSMPRSGKGFAISGNESRLAAGRKSKAASPTANTISDLSEAVLRHRKNEVGNAFLNLVNSYPNGDYWQVFTAENPEVERKAVKRIDPATKKTVVRVEEQAVPMAMMSDRYFTTKVDGKTHYIKLEDERLLKAMRNIGPENNNILIRSLSAVTRLMSTLNTSYNPEFVISNFSRDIQTAILNLTSEQSSDDGMARGTRIAAKTVKDVPGAIRAINASLKGKPLTGRAGEWQAHFDQFRADGAKTGWFDMKDVDGQMKDLEAMMSMAGGGFTNRSRQAFRAVADWVENTNSAIENGVRLSAYVNAIEAGISRAKAASLAKNMTVNFNRKGELGTTMNALYMFANASVQGTANFIRTLGRLNGVKGDPMWSRLNTAQKIAAGMAVGGFALSSLNRMVAGDDDDGINWWDKVPDYVKERNIVIMKSLYGGEPGTYWTIPLPYGYNIFPVIGLSMEHMLASDKSAGDIAGNVVMAALGSFSPIGFQESGEAYGVIAKNITPTILRPIASIALNENFMGGPIYKENFPFGTQKPDSSLYFRSTPEAFKVLAEGLNDGTGGSDYRSGAVDLSPDVMQFLVGYYGGGAYSFFTSRVPNFAVKASTGVEMEDRELPFYRKVSGKVLPYDDQSKFYDRRNEIAQLVDERKNLKGRERLEFAKEYRGKMQLQGMVKSVEKRLKSLRNQRDRIESLELSASEKDERLQKVERRMKGAIDKFNKRYNEASD